MMDGFSRNLIIQLKRMSINRQSANQKVPKGDVMQTAEMSTDEYI